MAVIKQKVVDELIVRYGIIKRNETATTKIMEGLPTDISFDNIPIANSKKTIEE